MRSQRLAYRDAFQLVKEQRSIAEPNAALAAYIQQWAEDHDPRPMVAAAGSLCPMAAAALQKRASDTRSRLVASLDERFEFADVDAWMENLNSKGYVVIK